MRVVIFLAGVVLAAVGGVVAYRTVFLEPKEVIVITETGVSQAPDMLRVAAGLALLIAGAGIAFLAARRRRN